MTQQDFLYYATKKVKTGANGGGIIYIWYTETLPPTIQGLAVPVEDATGVSVLAYLQQVDEITLPVAGDGVRILKIKSRSLQQGDFLNFYFFEVDEQIITTLTPIQQVNQVVVFSPGFLGLTFIGSNYNVLAGSIEEQRQSEYIFQSDRATIRTTTNGSASLAPLNYEALKAGTALNAYVQDSNYSDTGWTDARYEGTKTSRLTYGDVEPLAQGSAFMASFYNNSISGSVILSQSVADIIYKEYLYAGNTLEPVSGSTIFTLDRNRVQGVQEGKLFVKDSQKFLHVKYIPGSGSTVYSSSLI